MIDMFAADLYLIQDMILGEVSSAERDAMAAKGAIVNQYLQMALEKPKDGEE